MNKIVIDALSFAQGREYRVIKQGAALTRHVTVAVLFSRQEKRLLAIGETVTYTGTRRQEGVFGMEVDCFATTDGFEGEFTPAMWGLADPEILESVA